MLATLLAILRREATPEACSWAAGIMEQQAKDFVARQFYFAFSGATRRFDRRKIVSLTGEDLRAIQAECPHFTMKDWTVDRLARVIFLLDLAQRHENDYLASLTAMLGAADLREAVAIYGAFPLLPCPEALVPLARDGTRTNIVDVFDAIALDNPFPARHFGENGWNQMVLKALFISRPLYRIVGLDQRANATLSAALSNLAHERWAAGRPVSPELWRCCQGYVDEIIADDLERVAASDAPGQRAAAALVYTHAANAGNAEMLANIAAAADLYSAEIKSGQLTWTTLGQALENT